MAKLSMAVLMRNEAARIKQCFESFINYVDEIIVVDTGSTDGSKDIANEVGHGKARVLDYTSKTNPEGWVIDEESGLPLCVGFGYARQMSFDLASGDYIVFCDLDDILSNPVELRGIVDKMELEGYDIASSPYYYWLHRPYEYHWVARIARRGVKWDVNSSIHAHIPLVGKCGNWHSVGWHHQQGLVRNETVGIKNRNYKILKYWYDKGERGARTLYYLGMESKNFDTIQANNWFEQAFVVAVNDPKHDELDNIRYEWSLLRARSAKNNYNYEEYLKNIKVALSIRRDSELEQEVSILKAFDKNAQASP
jgi:glycosyltransferase involved in cell wall biosynthesis